MVRTIKMPSSDVIDRNFKEGANRAPQKYQQGVSKVTDFKERAIAGQALYAQQMSNPNVLARRAEKLQEMPDNAWKDGALNKGAARIGPGMLAGADKRKANYEKIRTELDGLQLAEKTDDFRTNINNNVVAVVEAQKRAAGKL